MYNLCVSIGYKLTYVSRVNRFAVYKTTAKMNTNLLRHMTVAYMVRGAVHNVDYSLYINRDCAFMYVSMCVCVCVCVCVRERERERESMCMCV